MAKTSKYRAEIRFDGKPVAVTAIFEKRNGTRYGITRTKGVTLRLPNLFPKNEIAAELERLENWVEKVLKKQPEVQKYLFPNEEKTHCDGDELTVGRRKYLLRIETEERETHLARLEKGVIFLKISSKSTGKNREKAIKQLLSRVVAADFQAEITRRVLDLNREFFNRPIRSVNLKYNHSNWGSCSSKSNVNLSTKLLFAPPEVQDYVIIHELAHLIELNHSERFWALVARAMPDFSEKERWLKQFGKTCDF